MCLWGCLWIRLPFEEVDWVKQIALPNLWASSNPLKTWIERTKRLSKRELLLPDCSVEVLVFSRPSIHTETSALLESAKPSGFQTGTYTISFPGSQVYRLRLELHISSPGWAAYWEHTLGLVSLHIHMCQPIHLICVCVFVCVSCACAFWGIWGQ